MARDALLIAVEQVVLISLELVELRLLFGDEQIVLTDLLVQILDLLPRQLDLLIDLRLLLHDIERLSVVCGDLCLELLLLLVKLILLRFQAADLRADIRGIAAKTVTSRPVRIAAASSSAMTEMMTLLYLYIVYPPVRVFQTFRNFRMDIRLPTTPISRPVTTHTSATGETTVLNETTWRKLS